MRKNLRNTLATTVAAALMCVSLAACGAPSTTPTDESAGPKVSAEEYLTNEDRVTQITDAFHEAEAKIIKAHKAGTLTPEEADVTTNASTGLKTLVVNEGPKAPEKIEIMGPIKGTAYWVVTFRDHASTTIEKGLETEDDVKIHDAQALAALEDFLGTIS